MDNLERSLWIFFIFSYLDIAITSNIDKKKPSTAKEEFSTHEVFIPQLYNSGNRVNSTLVQNGHLENLLLLLPLSDKEILLELHLNKNLFPSSYIEKYFTPDGKEVITQPIGHNTTKHCYYHGTVKDQPHSIVAVSTCEGIRGMVIDTKHGAFHIEPQESVITGKHLLFKESDRHGNNFTCSSGGKIDSLIADIGNLLTPKKHERLKRSIHWPYDANLNTKIVELYVANDHLQYENQGRDVQKVIQRTKDIVNVASSFFKKVNTHLALVGVEIWMESDKIDIVKNADTTMNNFLEYRRINISPKHKNDNAQLITGCVFDQGVIGKAPINTICSWQYSGGVNTDHSNVVGPVATTVAHEMGHNFGLSHDVDSCKCSEDKCIMNSNSGGTHPHHWSSCSIEQFEDAFHQGMDYCLHDLPLELFQGPVCGNGFMEEGEQCDCGIPEACDSKCCNATTCTLFSNATCATGKCCDLETCQYKPVATLCRAKADTCDLSEHCKGHTEHCPVNEYKKDGTHCTVLNKESYCYSGRCRNRESQCQKLWGESGHESSPACYQHFNVMGVPNGHCEFNWIYKTFQKCAAEDVMCGMLHCTHRNEKLVFWKEALSYTMPEGWVSDNGVRQDCFGAILDVGLNNEDPGMVPEGAKCAENKICIDKHCIELAELPQVKCPDCHGHGVCTNLGLCYCDVGYAPPLCDHAGDGGSSSSGSVQVLRGNVGLAVGMGLFFVFLVVVVSILLFCGYQNRRQLKLMWLSRPKPSDHYRAKPNTHQEEKTFKPTRPAPSIPVQREKSINKPKPVAVVNGIKRTPSFRPEDITQVKLESTTNKQVESLTELPQRFRSPTLEAARADPSQVRFHMNYNNQPGDHVPPVRPSYPPTHIGVGAHGDHDSFDSPPGRPPPPKRYLTNNPRNPTNTSTISKTDPITEDSYENIDNHRNRDFAGRNFETIDETNPYFNGGPGGEAAPPPRPPRPKGNVSSPTATESDITKGFYEPFNSKNNKTEATAAAPANNSGGVKDMKSKFESPRNYKPPALRSYSSPYSAKNTKSPTEAATVNNASNSGLTANAVGQKTSGDTSSAKPSVPSKPSSNVGRSASTNKTGSGSGNGIGGVKKTPLKNKPSVNIKDRGTSNA